jgi:cyclopropane-fatty-acyl-phospholipid synthase
MRKSPVALVPEKANEQHYEVPPKFFLLTLGPHLKYSSAFYPEAGDLVQGNRSFSDALGDAESFMLNLTCERAKLQDGQDVLELGCGWGSLSLWMAEHYPNSRITSVSNSGP